MYLYGFLFTLYTAALIGVSYNDQHDPSTAVLVVLALIYGLFGNSIYRYHLRGRITSSSESKGTNGFLTFIAVIIFHASWLFMALKYGPLAILLKNM